MSKKLSIICAYLYCVVVFKINCVIERGDFDVKFVDFWVSMAEIQTFILMEPKKIERNSHPYR